MTPSDLYSLSVSERIRQAFSETVDPAAYVPRSATESVLDAIHAWAGEDGAGTSVAALIAPPGVGKTFLLRVFEMRHVRSGYSASRSRRALYLPYAGMSITDLCVWIHGLLGRPIGLPDATDHPVAALGALFALADGPEGDPFILLLDDADSMPPETIRVLANGLPRENSPLRILMALNDDAKASRLLAALDPLGPRLVRLQEPMNESETALYLRARMQWAGLEAAEIARLDPESIGRIHTLSAGVPRRVHLIATSLFESAGAGRPSELDDKERRENWMGQPIEDDF
jgi:hypothetical protein